MWIERNHSSRRFIPAFSSFQPGFAGFHLQPHPEINSAPLPAQGEKRHADAKKKHEEEVQRMKKEGWTQKNIGYDMI